MGFFHVVGLWRLFILNFLSNVYFFEDGDGTNIVIGVSGNGIHVILKGREMSKFSWCVVARICFVR